MGWRLAWVVLLLWCGPVFAKEAVNIGVLAFRGEAETTAKWKPLEAYLNAALPEYVFAVKALNLESLREAVRRTQVDLIITQPAEYVRMTHENGFSSPLATLLNSHNGKPVRVFGGTIVTRADQTRINVLADLEKRTVAVSEKRSFAGYHLQAYALKNANVPIGEVTEVGMSQEDSIRALLNGKSEVAFVRSGLIESMAEDGQLDLTQIKVVNQQQFQGYPFAVSTALYPEWPVVALPHLRDDIAARLAGALLSLPHQEAVARQIGIAGFSVPSDYEPVRAVMRAMKVPPFDVAPRISPLDVWHEYRALILVVLASMIAIAVFAARSTLLSQRLRDLNENLETRIVDRTSELAARHADLAKTLEELNLTRDELVESAKLAALGSMVAGIAHELNTPIGNGLTVATTLEGRIREFKKELAAGLRRSTLDAFVADASMGSDILVRSLHKAGALVASFKQVAADQASSQRRKFKLHDTLAEVIMTLNPTLRRTGCEVKLVETQGDCELDSYPGPLGQIVTNLINNSVFHGYEDSESGEIRIIVSRDGPELVKIEVCDDGAGITPENLARIFEPFFTTRLGKGGSGLGLSIVRNMVVGALGGKISVASTLGKGAIFTVTIPLMAPATA